MEGQQLGSWQGLSKPRSGTERVAVAVCGCSSQIPKREWQKVRKITGNIGFGFSGKEEEGRLVGTEEGWPGGEASARPAPGPAPLLDNSAVAFTNAAVTPISQLGTWKARGSSGCGLCRGGGWHRCPSCPATPNPCPSTSDQTYRQYTTDTHTTHTPRATVLGTV